MRRALSWIKVYPTIEEGISAGKYWASYQIGLGDFSDMARIGDVITLARLSQPVRCKLFRVYNSVFDRRPIVLSEGPALGDGWLSFYSGVSVEGPDGDVIVSFGTKRSFQAEAYLPSLHAASFGTECVSGHTAPYLDRFIVGPSNKFAHAAAIAVSQNPGKVYNPLIIYGNSGLGKTHLLLAIGQTIRHNNPGAKIAYVKGEEFVNQMVKSIGTGTAENFRQKYRNADLLLMDDIQFIAGKDSTQEEFFHTFNCLYEAGKQIVVTSDRPPKEMKRLNDRLCSRLEGGLLADVQPPDLETRTAIIRTKAAQFGMVLSEEVVQYIAENITSNVRQLEGVVKRLTAYRDILDDTITVDSVKRAIKDVIRTGTYIPTPDVIIEESARSFQLSGADLRGQSRNKKTAMARQIAMYLMRNLTNLPLKEIGEEFGGRNHATVLSSIRKVEELLKSDPDISATVRDITSNINSKN